MTPTPENPTVPFHQNAPHEADPMDIFMPALQDAIEQLEVIHDAWWRVNDALLLPHTGSIWLEVNTVRSYVFDLNAGQFLPPETT